MAHGWTWVQSCPGDAASTCHHGVPEGKKLLAALPASTPPTLVGAEHDELQQVHVHSRHTASAGKTCQATVTPLGQCELKPLCHPRDLSWHGVPKGLRQAAHQRQWQEPAAPRGGIRVQPGRKEAEKQPVGAARRAEHTPWRATHGDLRALPVKLKAKSRSGCYNSTSSQKAQKGSSGQTGSEPCTTPNSLSLPQKVGEMGEGHDRN